MPNALLTDAELSLYARQLLLPSWDVDAQLALKNSTVIIIGMGGLGCPVAETLVRAGVGRMHVIDDDVIELSNLQRQTLFLPQHVGHAKADVAKQVLDNINPHVIISRSLKRLSTDIEFIHELQDLYDTSNAKPPTDKTLLIDCSDNFVTRSLLNRMSIAHALPLLSGSAIGMAGQVALFEPFEPNRQTGCYHCVFGDAVAGQNVADAATSASCLTSGVLISTTMMVSSIQASVAMRFLGNAFNPLSGQLLLWDGASMRQRHIKFQQNPHCPVCVRR